MTRNGLSNLRRLAARAVLAGVLAYVALAGLAGAPALDGMAWAQQQGQVPGSSLGTLSDSELWRAMRLGVAGTVSLPDKQAGVLIQSEGENWRAIRNGPLSVYGSWLLLGICVVLAIFFALRGRIRTEGGYSGRTVERFNLVERATHWLVATSFIVLALTGLNLLYGRYVLKPIIGADAFSTVTLAGKYAHNYIAFAFMLGVVVMFVLWVRQNLPDRHDLGWLAKGGGMFMKGVHPPARKFNAGQKVVFWVVVLAGISISLSGIALLFPFQIPVFAKTFAVLNLVGLDLPTALTPMQDMQLSQLWHSFVALVFIAVIIAHIYIGTLGMEGAFDAMGTGMVDVTWAREHHSVWASEVVAGQPAAAPVATGDDGGDAATPPGGTDRPGAAV